MDCDLKQWKNQLQQQHQSEEQQASAKIPRLMVELETSAGSSTTPALPLFVPEPNNRISSLSAFPDSTTTTTRLSGMGCLFSNAQWQELELQALIFKHMLAGVPIPAELLQSIKKSFFNIPPAPPACYLYPYQYQQYQQYQPAMLQSGYWGRNVVDPEPGRCRRTDGKKWRCSREIVPGHKYCERHVHRGRNRSRKLVETPTPAAVEGGLKTPNPPPALPIRAFASGTHFAVSGSSSSPNLIQLNQRVSENATGNGGFLEIQNGKLCSEGGSEGQLLRQFFDDWPRSNQDTNGVNGDGDPTKASLSIATSGDPSSDFSLKLSTGNRDKPEYEDENAREERPQLDWVGTGWSTQQTSSMGGPLAEALRSSTSSASPTSVLYELRRGTASETSSVSN